MQRSHERSLEAHEAATEQLTPRARGDLVQLQTSARHDRWHADAA